MNPEQPLTELIEDLIAQPGEAPRVSLYLPTAPEPERLKENEIRLKDQLKTLAGRLEALDTPGRQAKALVRMIGDAVTDWRNGTRLERGLAVFAHAGQLRQHALPQTVPEGVFAGERYHLKPLLAALEHNRPFYLLALSQNHAGLFEGDARGLRRLKPDGSWPGSLEQVAGTEPAGKTLHYHAGARGGESAIYHGHGAGKDDVQPEVQRFLAAVDEALRELPLARRAPVVLAGVTDLLSAFRNLSDFPRLASGQIEGNVEHLGEDELHRRAWPLLQEQLEADRRDALGSLRASDPGMPVARQLPDALRAAVDGRVDTLFVAGDSERWGRLIESSREVTRHDDWQPGDEDLLDRAAVESHQRGARVHVMAAGELPGRDAVLARLRY